MNVLAVGAHFDDIELGCAGSLAMHVQRGDQVYAYVATVSGFNNYNNDIIRADETAFQEGQKAMEILGVKLICGSFNTFEVEFAEPLNIEIVQIVEQKKIDRIYTHWSGDIHHDHHAVAQASLHSCRHVPRILMYRSNWYQSHLDFRGNYYIDITNFMDIKENAIKAHASELERTRYEWLKFFRNEAENAGQRIGVKHAEIFEIVKWLES